MADLFFFSRTVLGLEPNKPIDGPENLNVKISFDPNLCMGFVSVLNPGQF